MLPFSITDIDSLIIDFDGVLTDNKVLVDENGCEAVWCNRSDGLGLRLIEKYCETQSHNIDIFVLSTETNKVVKERCKKLNLACVQSVLDKGTYLKEYRRNRIECKIAYIGNDLNDIPVLPYIDYLVVPSDAHAFLKHNASFQLDCEGGDGVLRELAESMLSAAKYTLQEISFLLSLP